MLCCLLNLPLIVNTYSHVSQMTRIPLLTTANMSYILGLHRSDKKGQ